MSVLVFLFWFSFAVLFYCYLGYGILVFLLNNIRVLFSSRPAAPEAYLPDTTMIIPAYMEAALLERKIQNTLAIDYPKEKLEIIVVSEGPDDGTVSILKKYSCVQHLHTSERLGKYAAIKKAIRHSTSPIVVFTDANSMLNMECLKKMMVHYADSKTGGVAGEKKILHNNCAPAVGEAEGMYWQYESFLKRMDAELNTVAGASGELFSIRTDLFREMNDHVLLDDFVISMQVCMQGYRIKYEPDAFATESPSLTLAEEAKRKIRISAGAYQSVGLLRGCLNFLKYPLLSFQYFSRRLLRWILCPPLLLLLFASNFSIVLRGGHGFYSSIMAAQVLFYCFAFWGWLFVRRGKRAGLFTIPFYFVFMNGCLVKGFARYLKGKQPVAWEKSLRQALE